MKINISSFILLMFICFFQKSYGQAVPDGTSGEVFDTVKSEKKTPQPKYSNWNYFDTRLTTIKLGGGLLFDYANYIQDAVSKEQMTCEPAFKVRDFRIAMSGQFKFRRQLNWKFGYMYDGVSDQWLVRETGLMIPLKEILGNIFIGRTKEGYSLNKIMNGYSGWSMERQMGIDVIPILADGIKYLGYFPKKRILLNLGAYYNWFSKNQSFSTYEWQFVGRVGCLPIFSESKKTLLHLALNTRYGKTEDGKIQMRSRPEVNQAPYFVGTGIFSSAYSYHLGLEAYYSSGPWMFGGEYSLHQFDSPETKDPLFHGGEIMISWIMTGESRPYMTSIGAYGFVPVKRSVFRGGPGAWEAMVRMTNLDLDSGTLTGGTFWRFTPMVNWYLSANVRLELVYGFGVLDRFEKIGSTQFFQTRIQFIL